MSLICDFCQNETDKIYCGKDYTSEFIKHLPYYCQNDIQCLPLNQRRLFNLAEHPSGPKDNFICGCSWCADCLYFHTHEYRVDKCPICNKLLTLLRTAVYYQRVMETAVNQEDLISQLQEDNPTGYHRKSSKQCSVCYSKYGLVKTKKKKKFCRFCVEKQ